MSLMERCIECLWRSRTSGSPPSPLTEDELLLLIFQSVTSRPDCREKIKARLPHLVGRSLGSHVYSGNGHNVTVFWLKPKGDRNDQKVAQPTADVSIPSKAPPTTPAKRPRNSTSSPQFNKFRSPLRLSTPQPTTPTSTKSSSLGPRTVGVHRSFKSPLKSLMTGRTDVKQQLQNTGGQGDDADMWREQKELARSIMLAEDRIRKLKMVAGYQNEDTKVDSLIIKWRSASREALIAFRDAIGAIFMSDDPQIGNTGWGYEDFNNGNNTNQNRMMKAGADNEYIIPEEPRVPNLKELCEKLKLDVEAFGTYDEDHDEFYG